MLSKIFSPSRNTLIVGSAPSAVDMKEQNLSKINGVSVNNAWMVNDGFKFNVYAGDFPPEKAAPPSLKMKHISEKEYMPAINAAGGIIFCGATMSMASGYWAAHYLKTKIIGYYGCDMIYDDKVTHFYGKGSPDPLRKDVSLRSLEAKSTRLFCWALGKGKLIVNCSKSSRSRLTFPRCDIGSMDSIKVNKNLIIKIKSLAEKGWRMEERADFDRMRVDYFNAITSKEQIDFLDEIDSYWLSLSNDLSQMGVVV